MISKLINKIYELSTLNRRFILIFLDISILTISTLFVFLFESTTIKDANLFANSYLRIILFYTTSGILIYIFTGQYKSLTKYYGYRNIYYIFIRNFLIISLNSIVISQYSAYKPSLYFYLSLFFLTTIISSSIRVFLSILLLKASSSNLISKYKSVVIYGAGAAGVKLSNYIVSDPNYKIKYFLDDSKELWTRRIKDINIISPELFFKKKIKVDYILIAIPTMSKKSLRENFKKFKEKGYEVLKVPSINEITEKESNITKLKPIKIEDLLGRDLRSTNIDSIAKKIKGKTILVTGAGGSIGSELCLQILKFNPQHLILLDNHEYSLYKIKQKIKSLYLSDIRTSEILGSATNANLLENLFSKYNIDLVFHSAAYKHVPLLEENPLQAIYNNIFSTFAVCEAAYKNNIERLILISTDKAVRPTNVMGASKRVSELIIQTFAKKVKSHKKIKTLFSMVRFGNVLGSSGSVMHLFKKQIKEGGPITVTDKNIIRYFMTIQEAVELVLQATFLISEGGEVFLLEMGESIKIIDFAKLLIELSGLTVKDENNLNGDIEIICTGLRKGEKMYEELLVNGESIPTSNPLIYKGNEYSINEEFLFKNLVELKQSLKFFDKNKSILKLSELVKEWKYSPELFD